MPVWAGGPVPVAATDVESVWERVVGARMLRRPDWVASPAVVRASCIAIWDCGSAGAHTTPTSVANRKPGPTSLAKSGGHIFYSRVMPRFGNSVLAAVAAVSPDVRPRCVSVLRGVSPTPFAFGDVPRIVQSVPGRPTDAGREGFTQA